MWIAMLQGVLVIFCLNMLARGLRKNDLLLIPLWGFLFVWNLFWFVWRLWKLS